MKKYCRLSVLLTAAASHCFANEYAVQLEASKSPNLKNYQALSVHGNLYTSAAGNGYIRVRLGPYENKKEALSVLSNLHAEGYTTAFVAEQSNNEASVAPITAGSTKQGHNIDSFDVRTLKEWHMLTKEQQSNLVYLDGELHIKNGDLFIPLKEAANQN